MSVTATAIHTIRMTRQVLILVVHNLLGSNWAMAVYHCRMLVRDGMDS